MVHRPLRASSGLPDGLPVAHGLEEGARGFPPCVRKSHGLQQMRMRVADAPCWQLELRQAW